MTNGEASEIKNKGSSFGIAITYPLCGLIIERWGWEAAFYICGVIGTIWSLSWWLLVHDSPSEHPRITPEEKKYIITSIGKNLSDKKPPIPWKAICTDLSVWAGLIVYIGTGWSLYTLMVNLPTYFKFIHGLDIRSTGFISGMPHLIRIIFSYSVSTFGDFLLRKEKISRTNIRKLATFCSNGLEGLCVLSLAYVGCNKTAAIVMSTLAVSGHGAITTGVLAGQVDRSPNYSAKTTLNSGTFDIRQKICKNKCMSKLTMDEKGAVLRTLDKKDSTDEQDVYLQGLIECRQVTRKPPKREAGESPENSRIYITYEILCKGNNKFSKYEMKVALTTKELIALLEEDSDCENAT
ncbi:unnamed protein product [Diabrotica balteata]|uniref:Uncharacterized protein n=1 Tax=Diabrotica balteata TaxID=107213 RepID=A0A9N9TDB7_DIABA|nr:unnamed protein product [Diabrotica balteata]